MKLTAIAAIGKNYELGLHGDMPWGRSLKGDLQFFKKTTLNHPVLMGRRTWESLGRPLPHRTNIVITTHSLDVPEGVLVYSSLDGFLLDWKGMPDEVFVIGGGSIYCQLKSRLDSIVLTEIDSSFDADTWFPRFRKKDFRKTTLSCTSENGYHYQHVRYDRLPENQNQPDSEPSDVKQHSGI